jgi:uridine kinase
MAGSGSDPHRPDGAARVLCARIAVLRAAADTPLLVALDGRSGAGKSTLAREVGGLVGALVLDGDDFYRGGTDAFWDALSPAEKVELAIDWERQRSLLVQLGRGEAVSWRPYDWDADDGRLGAPITAGPAPVVLLDGAYSARPELAPLLGLRVLLDVARDTRRGRLLRREGERDRAKWEARWGQAEDLYFDVMMPPEAFDLVLDGN